jgi:hypothetical protein
MKPRELSNKGLSFREMHGNKLRSGKKLTGSHDQTQNIPPI